MRKISLRGLALCIVIVLVVWAFPVAALAGPEQPRPNLRVTNCIVSKEVAPGQTLSHGMIVEIGANGLPADIRVEARGLGQSLDGAFLPLLTEQDQRPQSARPLITSIDLPTFHLEPGDSRKVVAKMSVPKDMSFARYGSLYVHTPEPKSGVLSYGVAIIVPVVLTPRGQQLIETAHITDLRAKLPKGSNKVEIVTVFENTGTRHYTAGNEVTVLDSNGNRVAGAAIPPSYPVVIPGYVRHSTVSVDLPSSREGLIPGSYQVESKLILQGGRVLNVKKGVLIVDEKQTVTLKMQ